MARDNCTKDENKMGQIAKKRPMQKAGKLSPKAKKSKIDNQMRMKATQSEKCFPTELSSRLETQDMEEMKVIETTINELTAEAGSQPCRQP